MEKVRVQFDLAKGMADHVDQLAEETALFSRAEVIRRALSIYGLLVKCVREGRTIEVVDKDGKRAELLVLPEMVHTKPSAESA